MIGMNSGGELWFGSATSRTGRLLGETILRNVHPTSACAGRHCVLHNPSDHPMRNWPTHFRGDKRVMERICPHGVGHPDPDDMAWHRSQQRGWLATHGCDGCCYDAHVEQR